jgi:hypothetical protein
LDLFSGYDEVQVACFEIRNPKSKIQNPKSGDLHSVEDPADDLLGNVFSNLDFGFVLWLR